MSKIRDHEVLDHGPIRRLVVWAMKHPVVLFTNPAAGVGRSLVSKLFAEYMALIYQQRVLFVDLDLNATNSRLWVNMINEKDSGWVVAGDGTLGSIEVLQGTSVSPIQTDIERLDIVPAITTPLRQLHSMDLVKNANSQIEGNLRAYCASQVTGKDAPYDLVVIDAPGGAGVLNRAALMSSDHVFLVLTPTLSSYSGMYAMFSVLEQMAPEGSASTLDGILLNEVRRTNPDHEEWLTRIYADPDVCPHLLEAVIEHSQRFAGTLTGSVRSLYLGTPNEKDYMASISIGEQIATKVLV